MQIDIVAETTPTVISGSFWNFAASSVSVTIGTTTVSYDAPSGPLRAQRP